MTNGLDKAEVISIKSHPVWDEAAIQNLIAEHPDILGLGPLLLRDKERVQPRKGRLDLLLQSEDATTWYEVEVQLGATDEAHIIRTIEYWDIERKRYPDLQHIAVIVAEDITSRFFNVINLFNQAIPVIAIRMSAVKIGDKTALLFTKILDYEPKGMEAADDPIQRADRTYWDQRSSPNIMSAMDELMAIARKLDSSLELKFNKPYVGTTIDGVVSNFITFAPQKTALRVSVHIDQSEDVDQKLSAKGLDYEYNAGRYPSYRLRLTPTEVKENMPLLQDLITRAYIKNEGPISSANALGAN